MSLGVPSGVVHLLNPGLGDGAHHGTNVVAGSEEGAMGRALVFFLVQLSTSRSRQNPLSDGIKD